MNQESADLTVTDEPRKTRLIQNITNPCKINRGGGACNGDVARSGVVSSTAEIGELNTKKKKISRRFLSFRPKDT